MVALNNIGHIILVHIIDQKVKELVMKKLIYFSLLVIFLVSNLLNADTNQTKELSEEDKKWLEEYMEIVEEGEKIKKLGKTLDEMISVLGVDK